MNRRDAMQRFMDTELYGITASQHSLERSNELVVREMLESGIRFVQYREKEKSGKARYEECLMLRQLTRNYNAVFIIDDFVDLAMAVDADGVHIGQGDLPAQVVRNLLGADKIIGLSTHSEAEYEVACKLGGIIDYIGVGPVFPTQTKASAAPVGVAYVQYAVRQNKIPFVAIGGIKENNIEEVVRAGAKTICVVTGITEAPRIDVAVQNYKKHIHTSRQIVG